MLVCEMLAADADAWSDFGAFSYDFQVVFSSFWVSHAYDVPAEVITFVGTEGWTKGAYGDPVWAFRRHVIVAEACDVRVHFRVRFPNNSRL